jgi:hypothetical protein
MGQSLSYLKNSNEMPMELSLNFRRGYTENFNLEDDIMEGTFP